MGNDIGMAEERIGFQQNCCSLVDRNQAAANVAKKKKTSFPIAKLVM